MTKVFTNLMNCDYVFAISAKGNKFARIASDFRKMYKFTSEITEENVTNNVTAELQLTLYTLQQIMEKYNTPNKIRRPLFVLPTNAALRLLEIRKCYFVYKMDVEAAKARCVKKWIREQYPDLATVTEMLVEEYYKAEALEDFDIGLMKHHTLTSWELDQSKCDVAKITTGTKLNFVNGVDTKYGINCTDTNYLSGEYEVTVSSYQTSNGNTINRYYVPRIDKGNNDRFNVLKRMDEELKKELPTIDIEALMNSMTVSENF